MLKFTDLILKNKDLMNEISIKEKQKEQIEIEIKSLMVEQQNTIGEIAEQKIKTDSVLKVLNSMLPMFGITFSFNEDFSQLFVIENENIVDGFIFNKETDDWENHNISGKFSGRKAHTEYCLSVEEIYQQLEKLK